MASSRDEDIRAIDTMLQTLLRVDEMQDFQLCFKVANFIQSPEFKEMEGGEITNKVNEIRKNHQNYLKFLRHEAHLKHIQSAEGLTIDVNQASQGQGPLTRIGLGEQTAEEKKERDEMDKRRKEELAKTKVVGSAAENVHSLYSNTPTPVPPTPSSSSGKKERIQKFGKGK